MSWWKTVLGLPTPPTTHAPQPAGPLQRADHEQTAHLVREAMGMVADTGDTTPGLFVARVPGGMIIGGRDKTAADLRELAGLLLEAADQRDPELTHDRRADT